MITGKTLNAVYKHCVAVDIDEMNIYPPRGDKGIPRGRGTLTISGVSLDHVVAFIAKIKDVGGIPKGAVSIKEISEFIETSPEIVHIGHVKTKDKHELMRFTGVNNDGLKFVFNTDMLEPTFRVPGLDAVAMDKDPHVAKMEIAKTTIKPLVRWLKNRKGDTIDIIAGARITISPGGDFDRDGTPTMAEADYMEIKPTMYKSPLTMQSAKFGGEYLYNVLKQSLKSDGPVKLAITTDFPLRVQFEQLDITATFWVAPRFDD